MEHVYLVYFLLLSGEYSQPGFWGYRKPSVYYRVPFLKELSQNELV
jgi:hypothetical protein